ncbi:MAG: sulfotransferase [Leptolyngbya sp. SIO4C1]|nr:sulfotransferase [Leptolyngbya sp. SIO4C1]
MAAPKLFVVGCPRSGTSWVTTLIAGHPDVVAVPVETHAYRLVYEPFVTLPAESRRQRWRAWKGTLRRYGLRPLLFGFQPFDIWRGIWRSYRILNRPHSYGLHALAGPAEFKAILKAAQTQPGSPSDQAEAAIAALLEHFFQQQGQPGQTLLEKTPLHLRYADRLLRRFPEARVVEVIRDGRDVCASYNALAQQQAWARVGTAGAIRQWRRCIAWGDQFRAQPDLAPRIHRVRYEALRADPTAGLQRLLDFAQLDWTAGQVSAQVQAADISRVAQKGAGQYVRQGVVGAWQTQLSDAEKSLCHAIAGTELSRLGYLA